MASAVQTRKRKNTRPILSNRAEAIYQVDLCDMITYRENRYKYILCAIDIFSKKAYTRALRDKQSGTVADAMREIIETNDLHPQTCVTDNGGEFVGAEFDAHRPGDSASYFKSPYTPAEFRRGTVQRDTEKIVVSADARKENETLGRPITNTHGQL